MAARRNGLGSAAVAIEAPVRCGIYCRKSTTEGQDSTFNSLDNQQQAAEAYISSQRHAGWTTHVDRYHDYGFSGGNTDRPALKRLLADAKNRAIDTIVVYRLDRLSRSLIDFLQIHENLERWGVGLVSVTENINTTTPHGRMMVNVLLSFAQYERELIGERTRDKIQAARRRGRWTGGMPPLGYDVAPEGGKLIVNRDEATQVQAIFNLYLEKRSLLAVVQELRRRGWRRKTWTTRDGKVRTGREWNQVDLQRLLRDPVCSGAQKLNGQTFKGEHPAIITKSTFDRVQRTLDGNRRDRGASLRNLHGALLRGILHCAACGSLMTHAFTRRNGKAFRYYRCNRSMKNGAAACPGSSAPAVKLEQRVVELIERIGSDPDLCRATFREVEKQVASERKALKVESKRVGRELAELSAELKRLTRAVTTVDGPAADALFSQIADAQGRAVGLQQRHREVINKQEELVQQVVDPDVVAATLARFTEVWDVLVPQERERIVRLLIERVEYRAQDGELEVAFSATGAKLLVTEEAS